MTGTVVQLRRPAITSVPSISGRPRSSTTTSGLFSVTACSALAPSYAVITR
jgi:hypothetical protein